MRPYEIPPWQYVGTTGQNRFHGASSVDGRICSQRGSAGHVSAMVFSLIMESY